MSEEKKEEEEEEEEETLFGYLVWTAIGMLIGAILSLITK